MDAILANVNLAIAASAKIKMANKTSNFLSKRKLGKKEIKNNKITKDMNFSEIIEKNPEAAGVLMERGMHCIGCGMAAMETLEQGAIMHGMNPDELVKEINEKTGKK